MCVADQLNPPPVASDPQNLDELRLPEHMHRCPKGALKLFHPYRGLT